MTRARHTSENARQAKAWVNFQGTHSSSTFTEANGGIRNAFNVDSVTNHSAGVYTVNFETALEDTNYIYVAFRRDNGDDSTVVNNCASKASDTKTTTALTVRSVYDSTASDSPEVNIIVFG